MTPRSEPLLWLQLLAFGAIPLELVLLVLLLGGADPGPVPGVERLLVWGIAVLSPALLFWRRPPDVCSLLLVQVPLRGRTQLQRSLAALQMAWVPRLLATAGAALLLPLLWTLDSHAALASTLSPLGSSNRFVVLFLSIPLLTLLVWQWHQLVQALWLLSRPDQKLAESPPLATQQIEEQRISLGLPLLLLPALTTASPARSSAEPGLSAAEGPDPPAPSQGGQPADPVERVLAAEPSSPAESPPDQTLMDDSVIAGTGETVPVEPEETAEEPDGNELDENVG